jgi:hypothetical protein
LIGISILAYNWIDGVITSKLTAAGVSSISEFAKQCGHWGDFGERCRAANTGKMELDMLRLSKYGGSALLALLALFAFLEFFYGSTAIVRIVFRTGYAPRVERYQHAFPFGFHQEEIAFDQLLSCRMTQSTLQRLTDTGDIALEVLACRGETNETIRILCEGVPNSDVVAATLSMHLATAPGYRLHHSEG